MSYTAEQRRVYLDMIEQVGQRWLHLFRGDPDMYSAAYWDLLTTLWRAGQPMRKTDALAAMHGIRSAHTAGKYVDAAIARGLIVEEDNPRDARSKVLRLSPEMQRRLDAFFDEALVDLQDAARRVQDRSP
jgi:DNA-binding MarR family transcriptional regulator